MATKCKKKMIKSKTQMTCEYCGFKARSQDLIHKKCALSYVKQVLGYEVYKFKSPITILEEAFKHGA